MPILRKNLVRTWLLLEEDSSLGLGLGDRVVEEIIIDGIAIMLSSLDLLVGMVSRRQGLRLQIGGGGGGADSCSR